MPLTTVSGEVNYRLSPWLPVCQEDQEPQRETCTGAQHFAARWETQKEMEAVAPTLKELTV